MGDLENRSLTNAVVTADRDLARSASLDDQRGAGNGVLAAGAASAGAAAGAAARFLAALRALRGDTAGCNSTATGLGSTTVRAGEANSAGTRVRLTGTVAGWNFQLAVEVLQELYLARRHVHKGLRASELAQLLRLDVLQLEPVLDALLSLDWVGQINDAQADPDAADVAEPRYLLLVEPVSTSAEPLVEKLLLERAESLGSFWSSAGLERMKVADLLRGALRG